jgi:hypothetical protein
MFPYRFTLVFILRKVSPLILFLLDMLLRIYKNFFDFQYKNWCNFGSRRWGSSPTDCTRLTCPIAPHRHERKFSGAHVCRVTFKHLPQPLLSHIWSFRFLGQLLGVEYSYFCYLRPHAKFRNPRTTFQNTPLFPQKIAKCGW